MRFSLAVPVVLGLSLASPALAAEDAAQPESGSAFTLGQIVVTAEKREGIAIGGETLDAEAIRVFNRNSLDEAANLMPGVASSNSGGSRNERLIFVRGFDRFQVPLSIDGIRVYLPADNRLDYGRFLATDIAELQVAKGYASVLNGPGAMGGAINLVTRKPTKELEAEVRGTLNLDRDVDYAGYNLFALLGTRQEKWYAQASFTRNFQDHWDLPGGFRPTANEDGGEREFSRTKDWRGNVKFAFTPNDTDEYAISYTRQEGSKNAPLHVTDSLVNSRFWSWPYWNIESIYFLSTTSFSDNLTLKTRAYHNTFKNLLRGFDDRTQTTQSIMAGRVFNSWYDDKAYGGSAQLDFKTGANRASLAFHYRRDKHTEIQQTFGATGVIEPPQDNVEDTWSIAFEDELQITPTVTLTGGVSYDWRDLKKAEEYGTVPGQSGARLFSYPLADAHAWNGQALLVWRPDAATRLHASVSSRARFPTIAERFSSRFGGATSNPALKSERATNYELGASRDFGGVHVEGSVFYSRLTDVIVAFPIIFNNTPVTQSRNLGKGEYYGAEIAINAQLGPSFRIGANYTYTHRDLDDPGNAAFRPTGVPTHKAFIYADWSPIEALHVVPSLDIASGRWLVNTAGTRYFRSGSYAQANLRIDYAITDQIEVGIGGRNLFDDTYSLWEGFPEPGRSFFASVRFKN